MKRRSLLLFCILILSIVVSNVFAVQQASIRVQMYNANLAARINTIYPWYRITNTGSTPVNLADVKIRYFYTIDGEKPQVFKCDWSSIGSANVTGTFIKMDSPSANADYYFELGFKSSAGYLQPGKSMDVQSRFYKNDWSNYNQTNDYSFNPTAQRYVDWNKIAGQVGQGAVEDFITACDYTKDNQWVQEAMSIHLSVTGNGSDNATTYYSINDGEAVNGKVITLNNDGIYKVSFWSKGRTDYTETHHAVTVKIDRTGPVVTGSVEPAANANGWLKSDATVSFMATDDLSGVASVSPAVTVSAEGADQVISGEAIDKLGNRLSTTVTVNIDKTPPVIDEIYPKNGSLINQTLPTISANLSDNLSGIDAATVKMTVDGNVVSALVESGQVQYMPSTPLSAGKHTVRVNGRDKAGNASVEVSSIFTVDPTLPNLPPDPAEVAPKLDETVCTSMLDATKFLYTGENPIQTGVAPETIEAKRAAVLRGKVLNKDGQPLPGVKITVLNHPEYGQTYTRSDGMFDIAVNGGGYLTVKYERTGYLGAQRQVDVPWQDYTWLPEVWLVQQDGQVTEVQLGTGTGVQVARGNVVTDKDGTRQATIIFPDGVQVSGYNGTSLHIRATEFTIGENGSKMMPAALPPTTGYTYCVDLSADEAESIKFNKPVYFYVDNFIKMPVGIQVPVGYYDLSRGLWVPSKDGRVIQIIAINNGLADVDLDGSGIAANQEKLAEFGFTDQERQKLASLYNVGQTLWRVPMLHFSIVDCNYGVGAQKGAENPKNALAKDDNCENADRDCGSVIDIQNQKLGEAVKVTGTSFSIHYSSDRVPGRLPNKSLEIPLSGDTIPPVLKRIELQITTAGRTYKEQFPAKPKQKFLFTWDGKDAYGRVVQGGQAVYIRIGYVYDGYYNLPPNMSNSFGTNSGLGIPGDISARQEVTLWQEQTASIMGVFNAKQAGLGGWTLNVQHFYDPVSRTLYLGNGDRRSDIERNLVVSTVAGTYPGLWEEQGDNWVPLDKIPATEAYVGEPEKLAIGPNGDIYFSSSGDIYHVDQKGIVYKIYDTDYWVYGIDVDRYGYLYFTYSNNVGCIDPYGNFTVVAGTGENGFSGDNGPAINAQLSSPYDVSCGADGFLYIADTGNNRIRQIDTNGVITTIAGTGNQPDENNPGQSIGGPATSADISSPFGLAMGPDGSLYVSNQYFTILRISPDGIITNFAGNFKFDDGSNQVANGILATQTPMRLCKDIAFGKDGYLYLADTYHNLVRRISPEGVITTYVGTGDEYYNGENIQAMQANLSLVDGIAVGPDGTVYFSAELDNRVRKINHPLPRFNNVDMTISSEDGSELYCFNANGRHLYTIDTLTGKTIYKFQYDSRGYLINITDIDGNVTKIERSSTGEPYAIVAPFGQRTELAPDAQGYLSTISNPAGETFSLTYKEGGLLETFKEPKGGVHRFTYDDLGRLTKDADPAGGYTSLERSEIKDGYVITKTKKVDDQSTNVTTYTLRHLPNGDTLRITEGCCGGHIELLERADGSEKVTYADGTIVNTTYGSDPRFGMQAPITKKQTITTPHGLAYTMSSDRSIQLSNPLDVLSVQTLTQNSTVNGKTSTSVYDAATHTVTSTSPMGKKTVTTLDEKGRVVKVEVPSIVPVTFEYDEHGRLYKTTQGSGSDARISSIIYNPDGWVKSVTDPLNQTTSFEYDAVGRVKKQTLPDNRVIQFNYDSNGNMTTLTPPGKSEHGFSYNNVNMTDKYTPPTVTNGGETSYAYNLAKQPTLVTRPDGKTIGFEYDTMGRLVTLTLPDGEIAYTYDATTGQLKNVIGRNGGTLTYGYDGELPTSVTWSGTIKGKVGITYNNDFEVVTQSVNDVQTVSYQYNDDGQLKTAGDLTASYDPQNGAIQGTTIGNVTDSYGYTPFGEVKEYSATVSGVGVYSSSFTYDKLGRISTKTETVNGETYTYQYGYDSIGQLTDVWVDGSLKSHYNYDSNGNRVGGTYDEQDRMITYGENTYSYSANGELQQKVTPTGTTKYEYDVSGNLVAVDLADGTKIEYIVDGANRRIGKKVNGTLVQGFLYQDVLKPVAELNADGNVVSRFVYGTSGVVPDYMVKGGDTYRIISDHIGSVRMVVNVSTGLVVQEISYDEWGNITRDTNPGFQPFAYAGGLYDRDTKLTRFGARDYDPETGRWTAKDPIRFDGGDTALYCYVGNDPVNLIDPSGLEVYVGETPIPYLGWLGPLKPWHNFIMITDGPIESAPGRIRIYETGPSNGTGGTLEYKQYTTPQDVLADPSKYHLQKINPPSGECPGDFQDGVEKTARSYGSIPHPNYEGWIKTKNTSNRNSNSWVGSVLRYNGVDWNPKGWSPGWDLDVGPRSRLWDGR